MSLIKMLSFAKSLRSGRDEKSPYQAAQDNLMPDFSRGSPRPVLNREEPIGSGAGCARQLLSERQVVVGVDSSQEKGKAMREQQNDMLGTPLSRSGTAAPLAGVRSRWLRDSSGAKPTLRADAKGQLSLEFVKVVRNDLSDADLELVSARSLAVAPVPGPGRRPGSVVGPDPMEPEPSRWSRFTARLFGAGNPT